MAENTNIEWAHHTVNPWWGCTKISAGCKHCYAEKWDARWHQQDPHWGPGASRLLRLDKAEAELARYARLGQKVNEPQRVFIASMADVFETRADLVEPRKRLWDILHFHGTQSRLPDGRPALVPLILTKRPDVMLAWSKEHGWPPGAWAGTSVEDQGAVNDRVPLLCQVPAPVRFLSMEPLLGPVDLLLETDAGGMHLPLQELISWAIVGGESGHNARPMHPDWVRSLRDQCVDAGVRFLFKQWGRWSPACNHSPGVRPPGTVGRPLHVDAGDCIPDNAERMYALGKKAAGRELDGRTWDQVPEVPRA